MTKAFRFPGIKLVFPDYPEVIYRYIVIFYDFPIAFFC